MNIEIGSTIQTFEQGNEIKKNDNKLLFGRFFSQTLISFRASFECFEWSPSNLRKFMPYTGYNISSTVHLEPIL